MIAQFGAVATLVPPNFITTHGVGDCVLFFFAFIIPVKTLSVLSGYRALKTAKIGLISAKKKPASARALGVLAILIIIRKHCRTR
jgi:hypothetical protein